MIAWRSANDNPDVASFRYRVKAPMRALTAIGVETELYRAERFDEYDTIVFSKAYSKTDLGLAERCAKRGIRVVFDICDNHLYNPLELQKYKLARTNILEMAAIAQTVTCSTSALAQTMHSAFPGVMPVVIEDIAERPLLTAHKPRQSEPGVRLLWFGSHGSPNAPGGMADLLLVSDALVRFAGHTSVTLTVCSNDKAKYDRLIAPLGLPTRYIEWSVQSYLLELAAADAVVIPIGVNPFTACKSHNRLSSALYGGVPVVASGIDSYQALAPYCTLDSWDHGLRTISENVDAERERAAEARPVIDARWSEAAVAPQWVKAVDAKPKAPAPATKRARSTGSTAGATSHHGRVDAIAAGAITGWARNIADPQAPVEVVLELNGEALAEGVANLPRDDLRSLGFPHPNCGFVLPLRGVDPTEAPQLSIRIKGSGELIAESPILIAEPSARSGRATGAAATFAEPLLQRDESVDTPHSKNAALAQARLQEQIASVEDLFGELRRVLSQAVLAVADSPDAADRIRIALELQEAAADESALDDDD